MNATCVNPKKTSFSLLAFCLIVVVQADVARIRSGCLEQLGMKGIIGFPAEARCSLTS